MSSTTSSLSISTGYVSRSDSANDIVYVFFPQKKKGCTLKFTSFWRGPFNILGKLSEVLYEVDCGRNNEPQIIHCDTYIQLCTY
jgi:hypothetical protein